MNWFRILKHIIKDIDCINKNSRKITVTIIIVNISFQTLAWDKMYHPQCEDGLDIRKSEENNAAFY